MWSLGLEWNRTSSRTSNPSEWLSRREKDRANQLFLICCIWPLLSLQWFLQNSGDQHWHILCCNHWKIRGKKCLKSLSFFFLLLRLKRSFKMFKRNKFRKIITKKLCTKWKFILRRKEKLLRILQIFWLKDKNDNMVLDAARNTMLTDYWKVLILKFLEKENTVVFLSKKLKNKIFIDHWNVLDLTLSEMGNTVLFEPKSWSKDNIYLVILDFPCYSRTWEIWFFV